MKKKEKGPIFVIDQAVLCDMIEGKNTNGSKGLELLERLEQLKQEGSTCLPITTSTCLISGIWKADPDSDLKNLKRVIDVIRIFPVMDDFRDEDLVILHTIDIIRALKGQQLNHG